MQQNKSRLTVFFENPFWVCIYERISEYGLEVCKITFGAEPKDYEVYDFLLSQWDNLVFSLPVKTEMKPDTKINPKRLQREIKKQLSTSDVGTKAQQALKQQYEESKVLGKQVSRKVKEENAQRKFELKQQKRKEKHRGH